MLFSGSTLDPARTCQSLGFFIFREIPENLKIFETFKTGVRKNQVGQGTAELNEMVQYLRYWYQIAVAEARRSH